jgi:uncharacterized membrane protein YGL010W
MKNLVEQLSLYAAYHRDRRNIATHFVGIPMIVAGLATLLARPTWVAGGVPLSPLWLVTGPALVFYFALDVRYGLVMTLFMGLAAWLGVTLAAQTTALWLSAALGLLGVGWAIQFVGHGFEGRKPAFLDDLLGLLVGPLFIVAEWGFLLGLRKEVLAAIEENAGPSRLGRPTVAAVSK